MNIKEINKEGTWGNAWNKDLKQQMEDAHENTNVGMYLLSENDRVKLWKIELPVGQSLPFHKHNKPYLYIALNEGKSRSFYNNGKILETEYCKNDTKYFDALSKNNFFIHNLENIGKTILKFLTIEFKKS